MGEKVEHCAVCGKEHPRSALELSFKRPDPIIALSKEEREERCKESDDICVIKWERYFVRGVLPLPVEGSDRPYRIGAWAEVSEEAYRRILDLWSDENQSLEPPFQATLANDLPNHNNVLGLRVQVKLSGTTTRPDILITDMSHKLFEEQNKGISSHRAYEYSSLFLSNTSV